MSYMFEVLSWSFILKILLFSLLVEKLDLVLNLSLLLKIRLFAFDIGAYFSMNFVHLVHVKVFVVG